MAAPEGITVTRSERPKMAARFILRSLALRLEQRIAG